MRMSVFEHIRLRASRPMGHRYDHGGRVVGMYILDRIYLLYLRNHLDLRVLYLLSTGIFM